MKRTQTVPRMPTSVVAVGPDGSSAENILYTRRNTSRKDPASTPSEHGKEGEMRVRVAVYAPFFLLKSVKRKNEGTCALLLVLRS